MSSGSFLDDWQMHKDDYVVWRRFWALWELRRKWKWADWFYQQLDRIDGEIVETAAWTLWPGPGYMKLCLWIAMLRSVHEGITENLDSFETPKEQKVPVVKVLPQVPENILAFPAIQVSPFRDFRNAIFHCQWAPTLAKFELDEDTTSKIDNLHKNIGAWLDTEFRSTYEIFKQNYDDPPGQDFMFETFYGESHF